MRGQRRRFVFQQIEGERVMRNSTIRDSLFMVALVGAVGFAGTATDASAATVGRNIVQLAAGICDANNPVNDQYLRRLPSGVKNASTTNISVVCSLWGDDYTAAAMTGAGVYFKNEKTTAGTVTCTLQAGIPYYGQLARTKSLTIAAGGYDFIPWSTADYGTGTNMQWVNLQCSVPAGWNIREVYVLYNENVGA
jgi:hypothetical protein